MRLHLARRRLAALALLVGLGSTTARATACTSNAECSDGNACNGSEACMGAVCVPGTPITCDDANACTIDACDPVGGCTSTPTDGCVVAGKKLRLSIGSDLRAGLQIAPQMAGAAFPANFTDDDPVLNGASLRLWTTAGDAFDTTHPLPRDGWEYLKDPGANVGYRYHDFHAVYGPVTLAVVRNGKSGKVKARGGALGFSLGANPAPVGVVLRFGNVGRRYCMEFGGRAKFTTNVRFTALAAPAPTACP
jgi:hypothetical protein